MEILPNLPKIFVASVLVPITCDLGGFFAAIIGSLCLAFSPEEGWKVAFYVGAAIAFSSSISRLKLRETKEFLNKIKDTKKKDTPLRQYFERRNFIALLGLNLICPTAFYFAYSVCSDLLKDKVGLSASAVIFNNSFLLLAEIFFLLYCARLASRHHPFLILKVRTYASFILMPLSFVAIFFYPNHFTIFMTQVIAILSTASFDPAAPVVIKSFGISTRFSKYAKASAFAKAIMYLSTGYLTFYLEKLFGMWGVLGLLLFFSGLFLVSLYLFVPTDKMVDTYKSYLSRKGLYFTQLNDGSIDLSEFKDDEKVQTPDFYKHQKNLLKQWLSQ